MGSRHLTEIPLSWSPKMGWLILLPSRLPEKTVGGIILPESYTKKSNTGICVRLSEAEADQYLEPLLGQEIFFPTSQEYRIIDSDTETEYYIIHADHIMLHRKPPAKKLPAVSKEKVRDELIWESEAGQKYTAAQVVQHPIEGGWYVKNTETPVSVKRIATLQKEK